MNKKVFILPLAVAAMGLASCNKGWPTVTDDKADEIGKKIVADTEWKTPTSDSFNTAIATMSTQSYSKIGNQVSDVSSLKEYFVDALGGYNKSHEKTVMKTTSMNITSEGISYKTLIGDKYYDLIKYNGGFLNAISNDYTGKVTTGVTKDAYAKNAKEGAISSYSSVVNNFGITNILGNIKTFIESQKQEVEEIKKLAEKTSFDYHFESKDEKSLKIFLELKMWNMTEPTFSNKNASSMTKVEYGVDKTQITIEDLHLTSYLVSSEAKGKAKNGNKEVAAEINHTQKINFEIKTPEHDSINLDDYTLTEE